MKNGPNQPFDLCGLGMSMIDLLQVVEEFPAGCGVTEALESRLQGGGPVPTALCCASRLGARVAVIDRIGDDWKGKLIEQEYGEFGVDTGNLVLETKKTSSMGSVLVRKRDGERHVVFSPGNFTQLSEPELPRDLIHSSRILHLNGRHWPACLSAARMIRESGGLVSFDGGANRFDPKFRDLLENTDIAIVARDFAERFSGTEAREKQLSELLRCGVQIAGITDGENGSWFATADGEFFHQEAFPVSPVVDTTGCGDAFHGGFLFAHSRGWDVGKSARFASAAGAINATGLGGRGRLPHNDEVESLLDGNLLSV